MTTYNFNNVNSITKVQFLNDTSGYLLDQNGGLFKFQGNEAFLVKTPQKIKIVDFEFITEQEGAIIGNNTTILKQSSFSTNGLLVLAILLLLFIFQKRNKLQNPAKKHAIPLVLVISLILTISCSSNDWKEFVEQDPNSPFTTIIKKSSLSNGFHTFGGNIGKKAYFFQTKNGGNDWSENLIPTNFNVTSIISVGKNYFIGTYADKKHTDGDIWIYGNDSTFCNFLSKNNNKDPFSFTANRGINGLKYNEFDSTIIAFGSGLISKNPKNQNNSTEGFITELKTDIFSNYKILNIPEYQKTNVISYTKTKKGDIYSILDDYTLLRTNGAKWDDVEINNITEFKQLEFIPNTDIGYILTTNGILLKTLDSGKTWGKIETEPIDKLELSFNKIILIRNNTLIIEQ